MGSSDGGGGFNPLAFGAATPMPGLPVAGAGGTIGDPYEYGKFQNFLPDIKAEGVNDMATGLRPHMFNYTKPNPGGAAGNSLTPGASGAGAPAASPVVQANLGAPGGGSPSDELRNQLAMLTQGGGRGDGGSSNRWGGNYPPDPYSNPLGGGW
jgi:hypothetical protein